MTRQGIYFRSLKIEGWRQFDSIEIELHPRLTVLTGANGAGKSSLLRLFSRHFGFDRPFLATPLHSKSGGYTYATGLFESFLTKFKIKKPNLSQVGSITYSNGVESLLQVPAEAAVQYSISYGQQQHVPGIHIDSHQPVSAFQSVGQIPTNLINPAAAYGNYNSEVVNKYNGSHTGYSPVYRMKEAIISMAMFGEGNKHVHGNPEILRSYIGFIDTLRKVLPDSLGFIDLAVRPPEVVLVTRSGEFLIDASSGGVMTLIDLAWRLHMFSLTQPVDGAFVVTMDEPENHLHPTMQRSLMQRLLKAFPNAQFVIATHSPFMVSSVRESSVYVLRYAERDLMIDENRTVVQTAASRVVSQLLDTVNKAGSASDILREVLGVPATIPEWVEKDVDDLVTRYREREINARSLSEMRAELARIGIEELYPQALASLTANQ